ncbi:MAG: polyphosphate:AMP phosphotransferase [Verrucomicrobiales bacterium]|nr:polyphosphate:AMP phosphotransferase [Verrucomicrobiales bacterium]
MLATLDLSREVSKAAYRKTKPELDLKLAELQRRAHQLGIPVIVVFEGWGAAGKGTLINELLFPLDPRGVSVISSLAPTEDEAMRPFLWRFWCHTPARGRMTLFDRSWYRRVVADRVDGEVTGKALQQAFADILAFERQLAADGAVIVKFFLHISAKEQKKRFRKLESKPATAWRVTRADWKHHRQYDELLSATSDMLGRTDTEFAPWTIVEAHDQRFATLKIFGTLLGALEQRISQLEVAEHSKRAPVPVPTQDLPTALRVSVLDRVDLAKTLPEATYRKRLKRGQERLRELEHEIYRHRIPVVLVFEGWDAAGKGGNIKRVTRNLDPRGYEVVPIAAPHDIEKAHHYLWRFWQEMPKAGHVTIFDRSWYGRVLVERVEGYCTEAEWKRAYREINEMEQHLAHGGAVVQKFWLHISPDEQLRRFREREQVTYKQWKITAEDWRNREKWDAYKIAVDEMLFRTSTPDAPWVVVESNCKRHARVKVLETIIKALEKRLKAK